MYIYICSMTIPHNICRYIDESKVFTEVKIKIEVFWVMTLYSFLGGYMIFHLAILLILYMLSL
jgi:hypothetical protein